MWQVIARIGTVLIVATVAGVAELARQHAPAPVQAAQTAQEAPGATIAPTGDIEAIVFAAADQYGVPRNIARAVLTQESGGDPTSTSNVGAAGLMQVMPSTAAGIASELGISSYDLYDPQTNAQFGMYYLSEKIRRYGVVWGLAAYNWGPSGVDGLLDRHPDAAAMAWPSVLAVYGSEIPAETQGYVTNILAAAQSAPPAAQSDTWSAPAGGKFNVTPTMEVGAHFDTTDCGSWGFQVGCMHWGTDLMGAEGTPVTAPFDLTIISLGEYGPGPTWGQFVQGTFPDGYVFYSGHLEGRQPMSVGEIVPAGTLLGFTNAYNHTHIQLGPPGNTGPCAQSGTCVDFELYYQEH